KKTCGRVPHRVPRYRLESLCLHTSTPVSPLHPFTLPSGCGGFYIALRSFSSQENLRATHVSLLPGPMQVRNTRPIPASLSHSATCHPSPCHLTKPLGQSWTIVSDFV